MKITRKILSLLAIALIIFLLLSLLAQYINKSFIPNRLRPYLVKYVSQKIDKEIEVDAIRFALSRGFIIEGLRIFDGPKENGLMLLNTKEAVFRLLVAPSFKGYHFIIHRVVISEPIINLTRHKSGDWNISSFLKKDKKSKGSKHFKLSIKHIALAGGIVNVTDSFMGDKFQKSITNLNADIGLSLPSYIQTNLSAKIDNDPIEITSKYKLRSKELLIGISLDDFPISDYWNRYMPKDSRIKSGLCTTSLKVNVSNFKKITSQGNLHIKNLNGSYGSYAASGNYKLSGKATFDLETNKISSYALDLDFDRSDLTLGFKAIDSIKNITGRCALSPKIFSTTNLSASVYDCDAIISGQIRDPHKDFIVDAEIKTSLPFNQIPDIAELDIKSGQADIQTKVIYQKDGTYKVEGSSQIKDLRLTQKDINIGGNFDIKGKSYGKVGNWESIRYEGTVNYDSASMSSVGVFPFVSDAHGTASFSTKHITINRLIARAADTEISLKGSIDYKEKEPNIDLKLKADALSLSKLVSTLPDKIRSKLKGTKARGISSLDIHFIGKAGKPDSFTYKGKVLLKNASLTLPYWPQDLSNINCEIIFDKNKVSWKKLDFDMKEIRYHCYGELKTMPSPSISVNIKSKDVDVSTDVSIDNDNIIDISKLSGRFHDSSFLIKGKITDLNTIYSDLSGSIYLNLKDSPHFFTAHKDIIKKYKPEGTLKLKFSMRGPLKHLSDCAIFVEGTTDTINIWGLNFKDFYFDYRMKDNFIDVPVFVAYPYDGIINLSMRANLKSKEQPYMINIDVKDVDLHKLVQDSEMKDKKIKGTLASKAVLNGYLKEKNSMKGNGWLQVSDGYLWEFPVMRDMMEVIFMMPPEYVVLTDAFGNFSVKNNRIYTEDFKVLSEAASLLWIGSLGFNGSLDFNVTGRFAEDVIKRTTEPGRIASAILREAGSLIMEIRLTGTLKKPKYQIIPFPVKRILQEKIFGKVSDIFGKK
ncbi:DUF748 domain-containing protein [Candidatus Omnitrophota bacterium]